MDQMDASNCRNLFSSYFFITFGSINQQHCYAKILQRQHKYNKPQKSDAYFYSNNSKSSAEKDRTECSALMR